MKTWFIFFLCLFHSTFRFFLAGNLPLILVQLSKTALWDEDNFSFHDLQIPEIIRLRFL